MREAAWNSAVISSLIDSKSAGWSHEYAWRVAMKAHPPPRQSALRGEAQLSLVPDEGSDYEEIGHAEFFREATRQAYTGERPGLAHFTFDLVGDADETASARVGRNRRAA